MSGLDILNDLVRRSPRFMMCHLMYGFPEAVLEPGQELAVKVDLKAIFRPQKLIMVGSMRELRGDFKVKRTRLPLLDRDDVVAYTRIYKCRRGKTRWFRPGRTTIEYRGADRSFTRSYLPSSVEYRHTDPLSYVVLKQMFCGNEAQLATHTEGAAAQFFSASSLGNGLLLSSTQSSITMLLKNHGDVQVKVRATISGVGHRETVTP